MARAVVIDLRTEPERKAAGSWKPRGRSRDDVLNEADLLAFLKAASDPERFRSQDRLLAAACALLGLRVGEVARLRKDWVNFQAQELRIPAVDGAWTPKTKAGTRTVPYGWSPFTSESVGRYFSAENDVGLSEVTIWRRVRKIAEAGGLTKRVYPHSLRATAATQFASMGLGEAELCAVMGWENLKTAAHYVRVGGVRVKDALERGKDRAWVKW